MSQLKALLYSDLARQYELEGRSDIRPNFVRFLLRLFHFRYLPNVIFRASRAAMLSGIPVLPKLLTYLNLVLFGLEVRVDGSSDRPSGASALDGASVVSGSATLLPSSGMQTPSTPWLRAAGRCRLRQEMKILYLSHLMMRRIQECALATKLA